MLASFDTHIFWEVLRSGPYWRGALLAVGLSSASLATACLIGFPLALGRTSRLRVVRFLVFLYSWFFRATPTLLLLLIVWDVFPQVWGVFTGNWYTPFYAALIALSLDEAAYMAVIFGAGLLAVNPGEELAGQSSGFEPNGEQKSSWMNPPAPFTLIAKPIMSSHTESASANVVFTSAGV